MFYSENRGEISCSLYPENSILWSFPNVFAVDRRENVESCICSPWFAFADDTWRLALIGNRNQRSMEYLGLFLSQKLSIRSSSQYRVKLGIKDHKGTVYRYCEGELDCFGCFGTWEFLNWRIDKFSISCYGCLNFFCEIQKKEEILDGSLQLHAEIMKEENVKQEDYEETGDPEAKGVDRLVQNLKNLLLGGQNSDAVLKADHREFRVHKGILGARSPVFFSMFQHDMAEKTSGVVDIPDSSAGAFEIFLLYLYTGSAERMSQDNVFNLYYSADKYRVDDLKAECVEYMKNTLSTDTFCDVMALSLQHCESDLQKFATHFFCVNVKKIVKTVQWQKYVKEYPIQANELFIKSINA